jgi:hypothetical protein
MFSSAIQLIPSLKILAGDGALMHWAGCRCNVDDGFLVYNRLLVGDRL